MSQTFSQIAKPTVRNALTTYTAERTGDSAMARTYREIAIQEMLQTVEEAMSQAINWWGDLPTVAAWKQKPSYAVIFKQDRMINPDLERFMAKRAQSQVIELPGSHAIFLSHAREVAALIEKAATAAK